MLPPGDPSIDWLSSGDLSDRALLDLLDGTRGGPVDCVHHSFRETVSAIQCPASDNLRLRSTGFLGLAG